MRDGCSNAYNEKVCIGFSIPTPEASKYGYGRVTLWASMRTLKGRTSKHLVSLSRSSSETGRGACCGTRRKSTNNERGTSRRFSTTHYQRSTPQSYIACRNSKSAMPWVNHQRAEKTYLH